MASPSSDSGYLLGINREELERLRFQHSVWGGITNNFFDRLHAGTGWKCLDVGAGPGFVSMDLRERVGETGEVTALEPSKMYLDWFQHNIDQKKWTNVNCINASVEEAVLPEQHYDLVFGRWVIAFVPEAENFLVKLISTLKPGGIIAFQDYYYEGLSLFPQGGAFDRMANVVRSYYRSSGGDAYVTGRIPAIFRKHGLRMIEFAPHSMAGGPESGIMEWAHRFFTVHTQHMVDRGLITQKEGDAVVSDWLEHRSNKDALFFSPIVVDVAGVLP